MLKPNDPIGIIPKVGPRYKKLLEKLEIKTVEQLLYHFPFRYNDLRNIKTIKNLEVGETATVKANISSVQNIYTKFGKRLTRARLVDYTGEIDAIWFNQHYLKTVLEVNREYYFSGRIDHFGGKISFISPEYEETKAEESIHTGRLVPIYPETAGVSSKWLRTRINDVLHMPLGIEEFLPQKVLENNNLRKIDWSLKQIHFPSGEVEAKESRERFIFEELFLEMLNVEKRKFDWKNKHSGYTLKKCGEKIKNFVKTLPFSLSESQETALQEIFEDVYSQQAMNRLLEGDVGTGKTMVAAITSYLVFLNGFKTLYMAPTEILAKQHYLTFGEIFSKLGKEAPKIELSTGNSKTKDNGWDILIGTHSILFAKEKYTSVGLVVVDEQHRFGVEQRGKIIELGKGKNIPHLLTMSATPIPRTLALTMYGDLSISTLKALPNKRRVVQTKVIPEKLRNETYKKIYENVKSSQNSVFIVCPLIDESDALGLENVKAATAEYESLKKEVFRDISIGLLHGKMKPADKQKIIEDFKSGKIKVLVSTPVIEVGIDVPEASIMIIESAERYGLASLHQLRGRVGRAGQQGFCFVFMSINSKTAYSRLKNLEFMDNGIELAELDMKIRGSGDIFGTAQHGFKRFKIASLSNIEMLEKAKASAQDIFGDLKKYPLLEKKIKEKSGEYVENN